MFLSVFFTEWTVHLRREDGGLRLDIDSALLECEDCALKNYGKARFVALILNRIFQPQDVKN